MEGSKQHYLDFTPIHIGQRVRYNNQPGTIVIVADHGEYSPEFPKTSWPDLDTGFLIRFDNGALLLLERPDRLLARDDGPSVV
jgi:hypothetical protein